MPALVAAIAARVEDFDRAYSRFRPDSLVIRISQGPGTWLLPNDAAPLLALYRALYERTAGAVSPLVGNRLEALGYDRDYSLQRSAENLPVPPWDEVISWDGEQLTTTRPVLLDFGAAGKGHLVDGVARLLRDAGVEEYIVDASGDILHSGSEPLKVALEHPQRPGFAIGTYPLANAALCASAPNRRAWGDGLHHIIDATTGLPTFRVGATWAIASSALVADGVATALFFAAPEVLAGELRFEYVRMDAESRAERSRDFGGELFSG